MKVSNTPFLDMYAGVERLFPNLQDYVQHAIALVMLNDTCPHPVKYRYTEQGERLIDTSDFKCLQSQHRYDDLDRLTWRCAVCGWEHYDGKPWAEHDPKKILLARCLVHMMGIKDDEVAKDIIEYARRKDS
jgi:hypothetical protein